MIKLLFSFLKMDIKREIFPIFLGAILLFLATPPFGFFVFSYVAICVASVSLNTHNSAFLKGFLFGFIYNLLTMYWIAYVLILYGNLPVFISLILLIVLISYLSLYPAFFFKFYNLIQHKLPYYFLPLILSGCWTMLEIARSYFLTGFPWMLIGYTQHNFLPIAQYAKHLTIYGLGFIIVYINFSILILFQGNNKKNIFKYLNIVFSIIVFTILVFDGNRQIKTLKLKFMSFNKIKICGVQGNIDQSKKWDKKLQTDIIDKYFYMTANGCSEANLVVWPETALPFVYGIDKEMTEYFREKMRKKNFLLLSGFLSFGFDEDGKGGYTNSAGIFYKGELIEKYDKIHLVPFGEYVPLKKVLFFVNKLVDAAGDFLRGKETKNFTINNIKIGILICYESIFPEISRHYKDSGVNILVNITNDAWFGRSSAPYQHLAMSGFRAIENEMFMVRIANTGISAIITPWGEVIAKTELYEDAVVQKNVYYK